MTLFGAVLHSGISRMDPSVVDDFYMVPRNPEEAEEGDGDEVEQKNASSNTHAAGSDSDAEHKHFASVDTGADVVRAWLCAPLLSLNAFVCSVALH